MLTNRDDRLSHTLRGLCAAAVLIGGIWCGIRYALPVLLPFLLARLTAALLRPAVNAVAGERKLLRKAVAAMGVTLSVGLVLLLAVKGAERGIRELGRLMQGLSLPTEDSELRTFFDSVSACLSSVSSHLPFWEHFAEHPQFDAFCRALDEAVRSAAGSALENLSRRLPSAAVAIVGRLPHLLLFLTTWLLSCYDFCAATATPEERWIACLPQPWRARCDAWRQKLGKALGGYLRAYVMLGLLTFGEMLLALSVLRVPYALLLATVIALLDFLPVLGAGTLLLPWAVGCFLTGRGGMGTALLVILGFHTLLRQILEPRLVGRELGLTPLLSLVAVYVGFRLFGVTGMILSPLVAMMIKEILKSGEKTPSEA